MDLPPRFVQGLHYAVLIHASQKGKGDDLSYLAHILGVASLALEHGANEDEAIAALFHDAGEAAGGPERIENLRHRFGKAVADIVAGCTDTVTTPTPWRKRKEDYIAQLSKASPSVRLVAASDELYNARSILRDFRQHGDALWSRFFSGKNGTLWYYHALVNAFKQVGTSELAEELGRVVSELEK